MKRDMELIQRVLEYAQSHANGCGHSPSAEYMQKLFGCSWSEAELQYHVGLCYQAGYIETRKSSLRKTVKDTCIPIYDILNLTWSGHERLEQENE